VRQLLAERLFATMPADEADDQRGQELLAADVLRAERRTEFQGRSTSMRTSARCSGISGGLLASELLRGSGF
jgi:hypothetical protein